MAVSFLDFHKEGEMAKDLSRYVRPVYLTAVSHDNGKAWGDIKAFEAIPCE